MNFFTKKHISYLKRKTIANNKKHLEISLEQIFKTNHDLIRLISHKWRFKIENFLNTIARIFKTNRKLFWFIFHRWRFKHIKIEILVRNRCKTLSFCSDAIFHR